MKKRIMIAISILILVFSIIGINYKSEIVKLFANNSNERMLPYEYKIEPDGTVYNWIEGQGSGTKESPYTITSKSDFLKFLSMIRQSTKEANNFMGIYFEMTSDIEFTDSDDIVPLAKHTNYFFGHFDGKGHVVKNLKGKASSTTATSLFGRNDGVIANFGLVGGEIDATGLAADMSATIVSKMENSSILYNVFSTANLKYSSSTANKYPSGLVASLEASSSIINCYYNGHIDAENPTTIYGLARYETGKIFIINSFVGSDANIDIVHGVTPGRVPSTSNVFDDTILNGSVNVHSLDAMKKLNLYQLVHDGEYFWNLSSDETYTTFSDRVVTFSDYFSGNGSETDPYQISSVSDMTYFRSFLINNQTFEGKYFVQTTDLDYENEPAITGISYDKTFSGFYNGLGHVIKNLEIDGVNGSLFGNLQNGSLMNFGLSGGKYYVKSGRYFGTIARRLENENILNVYSTMDVYISNLATVGVGGLFGAVDKTSTINNVYYGGTANYDEDVTPDTIPFLSLFTTVNYSGSTKININNAFWPSEYHGYHRDSGSTYDFSIPQNYLGGTNVNYFDRDEMKSDYFLTLLNDYCLDYDTDYCWKYEDNIDYPVLTLERPEVIIDENTFSGRGTEKNPYIINNNEEFIKLRRLMQNGDTFEGKYFLQTNDLDFTDEGKISGFEYSIRFSGIYDGGGHYIKNMDLEGTNGSIFGELYNAKMMNFGLLGGKLTTRAGTYFGTIARRIERSEVTNVYSTMDIYITSASSTSVSGLFGAAATLTKLNNVYFGGNVYYDEGTSFDKVPFLALFSVVNYSETSTKMYLNNVFWPTEYYGYHRTINSKYDFTLPLNYLIESNARKLNREDMKDYVLLNYLNDYAESNKLDYNWEFTDESDYPTLTQNPLIEENYAKITDFKVDGFENGLETSTDKINWYKASDGEYYILLPKKYDRSNLKVEFTTLNDATINVKDESGNSLGELINNSNTSIFSNDKLVFTATANNKITYTYIVNVKQSDIPSLFIDIDGGDDSYNQIIADPNHETGFTGSSIIFDNEGNDLTSTISEIKGRGNKTWTLPKRPYQIKYNEKISMLGMKESKTWLLLAGYTDGSLSRNAISNELARDLGIDYTIEFEPAEVYINNNYMGSFLVTSKVEVDKSRIDIGKGEGEDTDFLLEIDNNTDVFQFKSTKGYLLTVKSPKLDKMEALEATRKMDDIKTVMDNFENVLYKYDVTYEELDSIIDMDSFAKFYWIEEFFENFDFMVGSCYLYYHDGKIHMGPIWDMDNTLNRSYFVANFNEYYYLNNASLPSRRKADWYKELFKLEEFSNLVDKYFIENKELFENLPNKLDSYTNRLNSSFEMNYIRWPYNEMKSVQTTAWTAGENNYQTAITNYRNNLISRYNFYNSEYKGLELDKVSYTYTLQDESVVTEEVDITDNLISIVLPTNIDITKDISLSYITKDGTISDGITLLEGDSADSIKLDDMVYEDKLKLYNSIDLDLVKEENVNIYNLSISVLPLSLEITTGPDKTTYYEGKTFDPTGMKVVAKYSDEVVKEINNYTYKTDRLTLDDTSLVIEYCGMEATLDNITIIGRKNLEITNDAEKLEYIEGDKFSPSGMVISLVYNDDTKEEITNYTYPTTKLTTSDTSILISYEDLSVSQDIVVKENIVVELIVSTNPSKLTYEVGDVFDPTDMVITAVYLNGKEKELTEYTYKEEPLTLDDTNFEIKYNDVKVNITLEITDTPKEYIIVIPDNITLDSNQITSFEISADSITDNMNLDITISSLNNFNLKYNDSLLKYKVFDDDIENAFTNNDKICTFNSDLVKKEFNLKLDDQIKFAGNYEDTLTFTVSVK